MIRVADTEGKRPNRPGDHFVSKIVHDPANPPEMVRLTGYRGASSEKAHIRLYANPELFAYWDIPEADVLYEQAVPLETDPLGSVTLWVKRDSKFIPNKPKGAEAMHTTTPYCYPGAGGGFAAAPQAQAQLHFTPTLTIHTINPLCHSFYVPLCPPSPHPFCGPSPFPYCVPQVSPLCPTRPTTETATTYTYQPYGGQAYAAQPYAAQAQAQYGAGAAAAPQGLPYTLPSQGQPCFSPIPHCTVASPQPIHCTVATIASAAHNCTVPVSEFIRCTIPLSPILVQCTHVSQPPYCLVESAICTIVASPNCPNTHPNTYPTTQPTTVTTVGPGTEVGGFAAQAQAAAPQQAYRPTTVLTVTAFPSEILYQCTHVTPASPYCTYPTVTHTYPTITPRTYGGGYGGY
jgi:hypothetical protein